MRMVPPRPPVDRAEAVAGAADPLAAAGRPGTPEPDGVGTPHATSAALVPARALARSTFRRLIGASSKRFEPSSRDDSASGSGVDSTLWLRSDSVTVAPPP